MRLRRCLTSAIAIAAVVSGVAMVDVDGARAETLRQALSSTYKYNPKLDAERARLRATDEEVARANAGYRPTITGSADVNFQNTNVRPDSRTEGVAHPKGYQINLAQPIFRGFRTLNTVREAEAGVRAGRETLRNVEQQVLLEAVTAYMDVVRDQAILKLRENNVNVLSKELKATQDRFSVGEVTKTDVAQAQARRAASVSALDLARANLKSSRATFERVVGHAPGNVSQPAAEQKLLPKTLDEATSVANRENPNVVGALYREAAARHAVDKIWGELLPEFRLEAQYASRYEPSRLTDQTETTTVTGRVNVPFYQGGEVQARVRQAKHIHVSRLQEIEQNRSEVQANVVSTWSKLQASRAQLQSDQAQVAANQTALTGVREEEKVGQRTLLDVLNAEQELLNSQVQLAATQRDLVVNSYAVIAAVGRLSVEDIGTNSIVYDPEAHYQEVRRQPWGVSITHSDGRRETIDAVEDHRPSK